MDHHDLETGVEIGDFRVERRIGAGGMGIVYQARQVSLDRSVALKVLGAALNRESDRSRFHREAQAVARLNHPGIAGVHFIGQDHHACYMAMEFIDGLSLRELIDRLTAARDHALTIDLAVQQPRSDEDEARPVRFDLATTTDHGQAERPCIDEPARQGRLTAAAERLIASRTYLQRCCKVAIEAAIALAHAHERGVVHRDVKPENILLDRQGHVHLIDFGVARFFEDNSLTNTGALVGTPMYMSPEQVTGRINLDPRTDVYSLGMVLFELLTLVRPIASPTREGILRQIVTKALPPASRFNPAIPRDLEGVLHKATAKDPDDRYRTATEFATDLGRWLDGKSVAALPYRYRLDYREIKAERPAGIMVIAFGHFLAAFLGAVSAASFAVNIWALTNPAILNQVTKDQATNKTVITAFTIGIAIALPTSVCCAVMGFGLLAAKRWAWWMTILAYSALCVWSLYGLIGRLFSVNLRAMRPVDVVTSAGLIGMGAVPVAFTSALVAYLLRRSIREWFQLAAQLRAEHKRGLGTLDRS
jgi:hypothetical protein